MMMRLNLDAATFLANSALYFPALDGVEEPLTRKVLVWISMLVGSAPLSAVFRS